MDRFDLLVPALGLAWAALGAIQYRFMCSDLYERTIGRVLFPPPKDPFPKPARVMLASMVAAGSMLLILSPLFRRR